jgi:predicted acylesterase/phospholipase RssA
VRVDLGFFLNARQALLPLPLVDRAPAPPPDVLPPLRRSPAPELAGREVVAADGTAASVGLIGLARAFEEAGERPEAISACSASVLWGAMWAAGRSAEEMAAHALAWRPEPHLGVQWTGVPRFAVSALRGFSGLARYDALEALFDRRTWRMSVGSTEIPFRTLAYDLDARAFEWLGTEATPELTLGELARVAVALPRKSDAVRIEGRFYVDARAVEGFRIDLLHDGDAVVGGDGTWDLYDLFLDRRRWPEAIRAGYDRARGRP